MTTTISNIGTEINNIISTTKVIPKISEQERIDIFLDALNSLKTKILDRVNNVQHLDKLFTEITWLDLKSVEEEALLKNIVEQSKAFHLRSIKEIADLRTKYWRKNLFRNEIAEYQNALEDFEDTVFEVDEIFFSIRKDDEFNDLLNSL